MQRPASLGVVLSRQGKHAEAVPACQEALTLNPKLPEVQLNLGLAEFKQGHFQAAVAALRAGLERIPAIRRQARC
jgi:tetratricopeptide (TPR) repeat protein